MHNECIDEHWMEYRDSSCTFEELVANDALSIERHALKVVQPLLEVDGDRNDGRYADVPRAADGRRYVNACKGQGGRRWGRIDFSKGFSNWWHLSHVDVKIPSEHTQESKRYDGELQMYHFYSVSGEDAGVENEVRYCAFYAYRCVLR